MYATKNNLAIKEAGDCSSEAASVNMLYTWIESFRIIVCLFWFCRFDDDDDDEWNDFEWLILCLMYRNDDAIKIK
jgi:hypothetical protein